MDKFIIAPHMRLQEWVAHEKGYFSDEGLDYEFRDGKRSVSSIKRFLLIFEAVPIKVLKDKVEDVQLVLLAIGRLIWRHQRATVGFGVRPTR